MFSEFTNKVKEKKSIFFNSVDMYPSWEMCNSLVSTEQWEFRCEDCTITFDLEYGFMTGGHNDANHSGTRPIGSLTSHNLNVAYPVSGSTVVTYKAPDTSGEVTLKATWNFPGTGLPSQVTYVTFYVYVPDLVSLDGNGLITFNNITSHPNDGFFMNEIAGLSLLNAIDDWNFIIDNFYTISNVPTPNSEGLSLQYGGLFDIASDYTTPHCNHRLGTDADIAMSHFKLHPDRTDLLSELELALINNGYTFPVTKESPSATQAQQDAPGYHWHAKYL